MRDLLLLRPDPTRLRAVPGVTSVALTNVAAFPRGKQDGRGDVDPRRKLETLQVPGVWAFSRQDNIVPVDLSVARLSELIDRGHSHFEYREYPGLGHELVIFDTRWRSTVPTESPCLVSIQENPGRTNAFGL